MDAAADVNAGNAAISESGPATTHRTKPDALLYMLFIGPP